MKIFLPPLEIGENEGFSRDKDLFGRKELGDQLSSLIRRTSEPLAIAIDGQWGSGKTTFLKMWAGQLRNQEFPVIYFDAFAHDYMSDAFTAIAGQVISLVKSKDETKAEDIKTRAKGVAKVLLRHGLKAGVRAATFNIVDVDDVAHTRTEMAKILSQSAADVEDDLIGKLLTDQEGEQKTIVEFRLALERLSPLLELKKPEENRPLVFIIDELDRCRPDFALSLLERMKHFFLTKNVVFVIGANFSQVKASIKVCYGSEIDSHSYLEKFFQIVVPIRGIANSDVTKYAKYLTDAHELPEHDFHGFYGTVIGHIGQKRNLSLRAVERIVSRIALALASNPQINAPQIAVITGLSVIHTCDPDLYTSLKEDKIVDYRKITEALALSLPTSAPGPLIFTAEAWKYCATGVCATQEIPYRLATLGPFSSVVPQCIGLLENIHLS